MFDTASFPAGHQGGLAVAAAPPFVHLATRTCYSLRDAVIRPRDLARAAAEAGMPAVGVADLDGLYGGVRLTKACAEAGVRPIYGADLALGSDPDSPARDGWDGGTRVILIARDGAGYASLCRTITDYHLEAPRGEPQLTWEQFCHRVGGSDGLFVLLGDDSPVARLLDAGRPGAAEAEARRLLHLVGPERLLVGVTHHIARGDDDRARARFALADRLGLKAVAHQAARYLTRADARVADVLEAVRGLVPLDARHISRRNTEGYFKTPEEMARVFAERPDALANVGLVAEECRVDLELGRLRPPDFVRSGDASGALRARCEAGLAERYATVTQALRERLDRELDMIALLELPSYFLTVSEIVDRIREKQITVACRGSAAGSLVTYCLHISDVDPIAHDLVFERFANPYRDELPDIDIDVESARREDIYRDLLDRYGSERVACVCMVDTFKARMAIREVGKALSLPPSEVDLIAKAFPRIRAGDVRTALATLPELKGRNLDRPDVALLFDIVERLDGVPRHLALHPSGVLLADHNLRDLVPMERSAASFAMAQYDKDDVEDLGLCKLDVLGIRMLSSMAHAVEEVRRVRGTELDLSAVLWDDEPTYDLIRSTRTLGMFQIESPGQRELLGRFQPGMLGDLVVDISLFRPGPVKGDMVTPFLRRRHGQEPATTYHPLLEPALAETHGVIVYHEQVMRCVAALTGCDLSTADLVRRRLGDPDEVPRLREWVLAGARERGVPDEVARPVWHALEQFASFGFCKAHAAAFAVPTYRSAWLKAHYTPEFIAGLLTHDPGMYPRRLLLDDGRQFGIAVLPLDVNRSDRAYRVERVTAAEAYARLGVHPGEGGGLPRGWRLSGGRPLPPSGYDFGADPDDESTRFGIRLALAGVARIDDAMVDSILSGRPFDSVEDLRLRAALSQPVAEALAHVGALDGIGGVRSGAGGRSRRDVLLEVSERWSGLRRHQPADPSQPLQLDLLGPLASPGLRGYRPSEQVRAELEVLGLDASAHVVSFYDRLLDVLGVTRAVDLLAGRDGARVRVAGVKVATQTPPVRSGQRVIFLSLDDGTGVSDAAFFESVHERCASTVFHSWLLAVEGRLRRAGRRGVSINAERVWDLTELMEAWRDGWLGDAIAAGRSPRDPALPRKLWHSSGGSAGA